MSIESMHRQAGLSLVELLAVLGIVMVVSAIAAVGIVGAMSRSELAVCGTRLKAFATSCLSYAADNGRRYPVARGGRFMSPSYIGGANDIGAAFDLRPVIRGHVALKSLLCPLSPKISLEPADTGPSDVFANYLVWAGWEYRSQDRPAGPGMFRMGDRWGWAGSRFSVLASDWDLIFAVGTSEGGHPDADERMQPYQYQDRQLTASGWDGDLRGLIDLNAGFDDGSVRRYERLQTRDHRVKPVPSFIIPPNGTDDAWLNVPMN